MQLKILEKKEEPLLSRIVIKASAIFEKATPSNEEIKKQIASNLKADENLVVIKGIYTKFGTSEADINAYVYTSKEEMQKIEPKPKEKKEKKPKPEKPAEAKPEKKEEAKKEEKPAEEKPEAPKEEKPKGE